MVKKVDGDIEVDVVDDDGNTIEGRSRSRRKK